MAKNKIAKTDFLEENLPQTRKEQFFDLLKNQYKIIFFIGLFLLLFFVPEIVKNAAKDILNNKIVAAKEIGQITEQAAQDDIFVTWLVASGIDIILYPIIFVGILALLRMVRQLIYGEVVVFKYDFGIGYKENLKSGLLLGLAFGITKFIFDIVVVSFASVPAIKIIAYVIFFLLFVPTYIVCAIYSVIYKNKFFTSLMQSLLLYFRGSWRILIVIAIGVVPYMLLELLLNFVIIKQIIYVILLLFVLPLLILAGFMVMNNVFDDSINIVHYPSIYRKGLYLNDKEKEDLLKKEEILKEVIK